MCANRIFNANKGYCCSNDNISNALASCFDHIAGVVEHQFYTRELYFGVQAGYLGSRIIGHEVIYDADEPYTNCHLIDPMYDSFLDFMWAMFDRGYPIDFNGMINAGFRISDVEHMQAIEPAWEAVGAELPQWPFGNDEDRMVERDWLLELMEESETDSGYDGSDEEGA